MLRRFKVLVPLVLVMGLLAANIGLFQSQVAQAHSWGSYRWNKSGCCIYIYQHWGGGSNYAQADAARQNAWNTITKLFNNWQSSHTDVEIWSANSGNTGWVGLATIWTNGNTITHGHSQYNTYYSETSWYTQGVFCQEDFHTYGFTHDNTGGCMGLGYYSGSSNVLNSHNNADFNAKYP